jgi:methionyl aminopeptidase
MRELFTKESDIQAMRQAGQLASEVLDHIAPHVQVGIDRKSVV